MTENREQRTENDTRSKNNVKNKVIFLGNIYENLKDGYDGSVFSVKGISPTITLHSGRLIIKSLKGYV